MELKRFVDMHVGKPWHQPYKGRLWISMASMALQRFVDFHGHWQSLAPALTQKTKVVCIHGIDTDWVDMHGHWQTLAL